MSSTIRVGDAVSVPGSMHGTVKFVGPVAGKKGTFCGVQLAPEYASRGKNSGEVEGKYYFKTTVPGSGIFLPLEKAVKRAGGMAGSVRPAASPGMSAARTPNTPTRLTSFNVGGRTSAPQNGPGMHKPSFSQSIGPGVRAGAASPALRPPVRRESLPRPTSPLRKASTPAPPSGRLQTPKTRPSLGMARSVMGNGSGSQHRGMPSPAIRTGGTGRNKFSQSLRQSSATANNFGRSPHLGPEDRFDEEAEEGTPTPTPVVQGGRSVDSGRMAAETSRLKHELEERDRMLKEQSHSIAEMEKSLAELQRLLPEMDESMSMSARGSGDDEELARDVSSLRTALREKNERIKMLTAEFDANRADFRSTIDTLEMASSETERVYEQRVDELLEEVRNLQDRSEDVENVAQQLKQLEELVQELEEGLEDARRGESEARGEVEFLRGEVERSRSELRRERERAKTEEQLNGYSDDVNEKMEEFHAQLNTKEDEIRGLKAIIHNLNNAQPEQAINGDTPPHKRQDSSLPGNDGRRSSLEQQIRELETLLEQKTFHEQELETEVTKLRHSVAIGVGKFPLPAILGHVRTNNDKHKSGGTTKSEKTVVDRKEGRDESISPVKLEYADGRESEDDVTEGSVTSAPLWCDICEEGGHDILTCTNMFTTQARKSGGGGGARTGADAVREGLRRNQEQEDHDHLDRPAPLVSRKSNANSMPTTPAVEKGDPMPHEQTPRAKATLIEGTGAQAGMLAGKDSGIIDPNKWCALCERDGHESVDCPVEDAF